MKHAVSNLADKRILREVPTLAGSMIVLVLVLLACGLGVRVWAKSTGENTNVKKTFKQIPAKLDRFALNSTYAQRLKADWAVQPMKRDSLVLPHAHGRCEPRILEAGKRAGLAGDPCRHIWQAVPLSDAHREYLAKRKELLAEKNPFALVNWCEQNELQICAEFELRRMFRGNPDRKGKLYEAILKRWLRYADRRQIEHTFPLPVQGQWYVWVDRSGHHRKPDHADHAAYAWDIVIRKNGKSWRGDHRVLANHYAWNQPVFAQADGVVTRAVDKYQDELAGKFGEHTKANGVTVDYGGGIRASYGHLKRGSAKVTVGQKVKAGQELARVGNSGSSGVPHLHFTFQDSEGLPIKERYRFMLKRRGSQWLPVDGKGLSGGTYIRNAPDYAKAIAARRSSPAVIAQLEDISAGKTPQTERPRSCFDRPSNKRGSSPKLVLTKTVDGKYMAPPIQAETLDGKVFRLSDYRGKYVLLNFWEIGWCEFTPSDDPSLQAVHEAFGKDDRFVIISVSLDRNIKALKGFIAKHGMKWTQSLLADGSRTTVSERYGVQRKYLPANFLIDPQGKIIARDLRSPDVKRVVSEVLNKTGTTSSTRGAPQPAAPKVKGPYSEPASIKKLSESPVTPAVWVLHDEDPDYKKPPFGDTLTMLSESGKVGLRLSGFNICGTAGGNRAIVSSDSGQAVVICESVARRISKYDLQGNLLFAVRCRPAAADVTSDGTIYALTFSGTIYGDSILRISPKGEILATKRISGFDLAVDEKRKALYVVGSDIKYVGFDLREKWSLGPIVGLAVSVDICSDGSAWIAEQGYPFPRKRTLPRLIHVSSQGQILHTVQLSRGPACVRVDRTDDSVYVVSDKLYKYDKDGRPLWTAELGQRGWSLAIAADRNVWVATRGDVRQFSPEGKQLLRVDEFPNIDQKYIACWPTRQ